MRGLISTVRINLGVSNCLCLDSTTLWEVEPHKNGLQQNHATGNKGLVPKMNFTFNM